jgi:hypothetical protein
MMFYDPIPYDTVAAMRSTVNTSITSPTLMSL